MAHENDSADTAHAGVDFDTAVGDPGAYYGDPSAIAADDTLTREQKLRFLREWAQDLADRQMADSEGMAPERVGAVEADAALVKQVSAAITQAEEQADDASAPAAPRTLWERITGRTG